MARNTRSRPASEAADELEGAAATTPEPEAPEASTEPSDAATDASEEVPEAFVSEARPGEPYRPLGLLPIVPAERKKNPRVFARVSDNGTVLEIIQEVQNIEEEWYPSLLKTFVEITDEKEKPAPGWTRDGEKFKKPEPVELTLAQKRRIALEVEGVSITRDGGNHNNVRINGELWTRLQQVAQHAALFQELPGGDLKLPGNPPLIFKTAEDFLATFKALSAWRERWNQYVDGTLDTAPSSDLTV